MTALDEGLKRDAVARLAALVGHDAAVDMLERFRARLAPLTRHPERTDDATWRDVAHGIGGLAGVLGFAELSDRWIAVERDGPDRLPAALDAASATLRALDGMLARAP